MQKRQKIIETGKKLKLKGVRYKLGAKAIPPQIPTYLDCSGFVRYCYLSAGLRIPDGTYYQWQESEPVKNLQVGDIGIMHDPAKLCKKVNHIGIYVGNGEWMHCNYSRNGITIEKTDIFKHHRRFKNVDFGEEQTNYMKKECLVNMNGKSEKLQLIDEEGHKYIKLQDLWKFGYKITGNEKEVVIK